MTRLVEDDVVEKLVVGMVFLMTGASFCNNVTVKRSRRRKKTVQYEKKGYQKVNLQANQLNIK